MFATAFSAKRVFETFNEYTENALHGDLQLLPEVNNNNNNNYNKKLYFVKTVFTYKI